MMKKLLFLTLVIVCLSVVSVFGQASGIVKADLSQAEIDRIMKKFTQNEFLFRQALNVYAFNRYATMQTVGLGGNITGTYKRDSYLTFNEAGERFEKLLFAPVSTMTEIVITAADIENLGGIDPFAIEPKMASKYNIKRKTYMRFINHFQSDQVNNARNEQYHQLNNAMTGRLALIRADIINSHFLRKGCALIWIPRPLATYRDIQ